jgi:hypothetical protein
MKAIAKKDLELKEAVERKIEQYLAKKGDKLRQPRAAFITFEFSDAVNFIREMSN